MTLFIVKIAPKQRSIHEKFLGIVGELSLIRENTCQSSSLSSDTKHRAVSHQTPPPATTETPPAGNSDNQSAQTKTPKFPQLEPMP